jgi:two-component system, sensor histidine kinase and response regulator
MTPNYEDYIKENNPLILIVDDIPKNLQVLSSILSIEGYQISFASDGKQALSVVETTIPDLILLDIMMPEMDGYEVCKQLKKNESTKDIPVIFLTGKADTDDVVSGLKLGAVDYITKPFNSAELLTRIRTHLELKISRDMLIKYNKELVEARDELKKINDSKDTFFSIIAHDLRGPFSGFLGLSELLLDEYDDLQQEEISQIADSMNKAAKRLYSFLENLLEWSRSQMGRVEFYPNRLDISETITRIYSLFSVTAEDKKINTVSNIPKDTFVYADNNMLNTILRNLVSNALKFTKQGGQITVDVNNENDDFLIVSVADNGVGMNDEAKDKIFRIDTKHSTPGTANEQGSGLGLLLCKDLVEKHNGRIWVESEVGKGTTFYFTLPLKEELLPVLEKES